MDLLETSRSRLLRLCDERGAAIDGHLTVRPLSPSDAIGSKAPDDFVIKKGKERVIEAVFQGAKGQAFTDHPAEWSGSLEEMLSLGLSDVRNRAIFVAGMNAVLRSLGVAAGTVHCRNEDPVRCGPVLAERVEQKYGIVRVGLIGLQPAMLAALAARFGPDRVRALDLNPDNIGSTKSGVPIWDGSIDLPRLVDWCEVGLATGSSIVNGTIDAILGQFRAAGKPVVFFGNTISGAAALLSLSRVCPFGT